MKIYLLLPFLLLILSCNENTGNFVNLTLEVNGTPEQAKEAYKSVLARLDRLNIGGNGFETRLEGNSIYLKLPENKFMQQNPNRVNNYLQYQGQLTFSEVYYNTEIFPMLFANNDSNDLNDAFNKRLFQIMQLQTIQSGNSYSIQQSPVIGFVKLTDTALVAAMLRDSLPLFVPVNNIKFMFGPLTAGDYYPVVAINTSPLKSLQPQLESIELESNNDGGNNNLMIDMKFTPAYTLRWANMTRSNIGRTIAIIVDGQLYSYPTVQSEITGGQTNITGGFDKEKGEVLVNTMRNGYPCPVKIIEQTRTDKAK